MEDDFCPLLTSKPYQNKLDAQSFSRTSPEVFDDLRREDDDPASDGYGAAYSRDGLDVQTVAS